MDIEYYGMDNNYYGMETITEWRQPWRGGGGHVGMGAAIVGWEEKLWDGE